MINKKNPEKDINYILIAEDSPTQAIQIKYLLEKHNYKVMVAKNGKEALGMVIKEKPYLIISDIIMPEMDGYEFCRKIKTDENTMDIPVILLTSLARSEDILEGLECGADNFITKPYREDYLISHIEQILANRKIYKNERIRIGVEIIFGGKKRFISASQQQMLTLLISTYEAAVQKNEELVQAQDDLIKLNEHLEELVIERTAELSAEIAIRKRAEERVIKLNRIYAVLSNINQAIVRIRDINQLLKDACLIAVDEGKFQSAWAGIVKNETKEIENSATAGLANNLFEVGPKQNPVTGVISSGKHFISNNINADKSIHEIWKQNSLSLGFKSFAVFPLIVLEKVIGSFCIYSDEVDFFDEIEISLLDEMANDISFAIEFIQKEFERKRAEDELSVSLTKYKTLFDSFPLGITVSDDAGNILETNSAAETLLGIPQTDQNQRDIDSSEWHIVRPDGTPMPPDEYASVRALKQQCKVENVEMGIVKPDNMITWINVTATPLPLEGYGVVITYNDITERKRAEEEMNSQKEMLQKIFNHIPVMITYFVETGNIKMINHELVKRLGWSFEEWQTENIMSKCYPDPKAYKEVFDFMTSKPKGWKEFKITTKFDTIIDTTWTNISLPNGVSIGIGQDISERKRVENCERLARDVLDVLNHPETVTDTIRSLILLIKNAIGIEGIGIRLREGDDYPYYETNGFSEDFLQTERFLCERDKTGNLVRDSKGNPVLECMCGNIICSRTDTKQPFFTEGGSFWTNSTTKLLASTTENDRQSHTRNRCNGEGYESVALIPLRSDNRIIGLLQLNDHRKEQFVIDDIRFFEGLGAAIGIALSRKQMENTLSESENNFRAIFENNSAAIAIIEPDTTISMVNEAYCQISGYTKQEVIGLSWTKQIPPADLERLKEYNRLRLSDPKNAPDKYEFTFIHKNGDIKHALMSVAMIQNNKKIVTSFIDITERKRAEEVSKKEQALSNAIIDSIPGTFYMLDETGQYVRWNAYQRDEIVGKPDDLVGSTNALDTIHPDDRGLIQSKIVNVLANGVDEMVEGRVLLRGGPAARWLVMTGCRMLIDGHPFLIGIGIDITDRKLAEEEIKNRVEELERFHRLAVGRETKMIELKQKINELSARLGLTPAYDLTFINEINDIYENKKTL